MCIHVYSCFYSNWVLMCQSLMVSDAVVDGLWCGRRWSLMPSEIVSVAVRDSLCCGRFFCCSKSKSDFSEWRAKLACALPSAKAFRAKLKERFQIHCKGTHYSRYHQISPLMVCKNLLKARINFHSPRKHGSFGAFQQKTTKLHYYITTLSTFRGAKEGVK